MENEKKLLTRLYHFTERMQGKWCEKWNVWGIRVRAQYFVAGRYLLGFTILLGWYNSVVMTHPGRKTENTSWRLGEN